MSEPKLRPMAEGETSAPLEILVATKDRYGNRRWVVMHYAWGGGEDQPPFRGWFYHCGDGYAHLPATTTMLGWIPIPDVDVLIKTLEVAGG